MSNQQFDHNEKITLLFSGSGTKGDLFPLLCVAQELSNRGYPIVFLTNDYYRDLVLSHGFHFLSSGKCKDHIAFISNPKIWDPNLDAAEIAFQDGYLEQQIRASYLVVFDFFKSKKSVAVLGTYPLLNGATMAADFLKLPHISITLSPRYIPSNIAPPAPLGWMVPHWLPQTIRQALHKAIGYSSQRYIMRKEYFGSLNRMRKSIGLKALESLSNDVTFPNRHLHLAMFPGWYGMRAADWPSRVHAVGFPSYDQIDHVEHQVVDDFIEAQGSPVIFTTGTGIMNSEAVFDEAKKICDSIEVPGLFVGSIGSRKESYKGRHLQVDYVNFKHILPRCRALVHHGGIGTLAEAVRSGIPQIIRPLAFDQFDNADRVHRLGLGTFVLPMHFRERKVTPIMRKILAYRNECSLVDKYSKLANKDKAAARAADLVENYLSNYSDTYPDIKQTADSPNPGFSIESNDRIGQFVFMRSRHLGEDGLVCVAMMLKYCGHSLALKSLRRRYSQFRWGMTVEDMIELFASQGFCARAFRCDADRLSELSTPCIAHWNLRGFVVLIAIAEDSVSVADPTSRMEQLNFAQFGWHYSGTVVEIQMIEEADR